MGRKQKLIQELNSFAVKISQEYPLQKMILFGSRAKGKHHEDSDVDLLLVSPKFRKKRRLQRSPPLYLKWNLNYPVDFLCYTPEEFERKKNKIGIVHEALAKGIDILKK